MKKLLQSFLFVLFSAPVAAGGLQGQNAPDFDLRGLITGEPTKLSQFKGKVVYLDFWASWCGHCQKSFPQLNELRNELHDKGFEVVAVNLDQNPNDGRKFLKSHPVDFVVLADSKGTTPRQYKVKAMPSSFLIDSNGKVRMSHAGFRDGDIDKIRTEIVKLLKE